MTPMIHSIRKPFPGNLTRRTSRWALTALLGGGLLLGGCDATSAADGDTTLQGRVTDDGGFGKNQASIEGAVVTATSVDAQGRTRALDGQATTDAEGRYTLETDADTEILVATAQKGSFRSKVLVYTDGRSRVQAMPMTVESEAEADVYVAARQNGDRDEAEAVTVADVALHVTHAVAADIESGATTAVEVAAALRAGAAAEEEYIEDEEGDDEVARQREEEQEAFLQLQASLSASGSTQAESQALLAFEQALLAAWTEAGVSARTQARARQAAKAAVVRFSGNASLQTRLALRKQAALMAAHATQAAVEAQFRAEGASQATLNSLTAAGAAFTADVRAAGSASALTRAESDYSSAVEAALAAELNVNAATLTAAKIALATVDATLDASVNAAANAKAVVDAYTAFYATAETVLEQSFSGTSRASLAASVLATLSAQ